MSLGANGQPAFFIDRIGAAPRPAQLSIMSVSLLSLRGAEDLTAAVAWGVLHAVVTALLMNVAIVGFNQVCDVEIDKARYIT